MTLKLTGSNQTEKKPTNLDNPMAHIQNVVVGPTSLQAVGDGPPDGLLRPKKYHGVHISLKPRSHEIRHFLEYVSPELTHLEHPGGPKEVPGFREVCGPVQPHGGEGLGPEPLMDG